MEKFFVANLNSDTGTSRILAMDSAKNSGNRTIQPFATDFGGCDIELRMIPKGIYTGVPTPDDSDQDEVFHTFTSADNYLAIVTDEISLDYDLYCNVTGGSGVDELNINFS